MSEPESYNTPDEAAQRWLPAWFVPRMMAGNGGLALWLTTGIALPLERIERIHRASDGSIWLDVIVSLAEGAAGKAPAVSGSQASINAAHVVAAVETGHYDARSAWDNARLEVSGRMRVPGR